MFTDQALLAPSVKAGALESLTPVERVRCSVKSTTIGSVGGIAFLGSESPEAVLTFQPSIPLRYYFFRSGAALQYSSTYVGSSMLRVYGF